MTKVCFTDVGFPTNIVISNKIDQWRNKTFSLDEVVFGEVSSRVIPVVARMFPAWEFVVRNIHMEGIDARRKVYVRHVMVSEKGVPRGEVWCNSPWWQEELELHNPRIHNAMQRVGYKTTSKATVAVQTIKRYFTDPPLAETIAVVSKQIRSEVQMQRSTFKSSKNIEYLHLTKLLQPYIEQNIQEIATQVAEVNTNFNLPAYLELIEDTKIAASVVEPPANSALTVMLHDDKYVLHRNNMPIFALTSEYLPEQVRMAIGMLKLVEDGQFVRGMGYRYKANQFLVVYDGPFNEELACKTLN
jgi:hypothetical protein